MKEGVDGMPLERGYSVLESVIDEECGGYRLTDGSSHEAGFDALMTCYTFINAMQLLNKPATALIA